VIVVLTVAAAVGLASLRSIPSYAAAPPLTSTQIADAVLFNEGPAARYLTSVDRSPITWTAKLREMQAGVKRALDTDQSGYFRVQFVQQMQSGDPAAVRSALTRLGQTTLNYLETRYGKGEVDTAVRSLGISWQTDAASSSSVEIASNVAAVTDVVSVLEVYAIAVAVLIAIIVLAIPGDSTKAQLAEETFVNKVAAGLRAAH
jgi:SdpC family antimicrobial peptide